MNNARMIELAEHLESLPRKRFDMTSFWNVVRSRKPGAADPDEVLNEGRESAKRIASALQNHCNTTACIAGWAVALHPRAGGDVAKGRYSTWTGEHHYDISDHAQAILGLDREDASRLFHQGMRMTPRQAAKRIRKAVKRGYVEDIGD
jgi:hypothetical protein